MENLLTKSYSDKDVNGVLAPYDGLSRGIIAALKGSGYGSGGKTLPVVTGQDAELESVKSILADEQYSSVFKNTQDLAKSTVAMIQEILEQEDRHGQRHHVVQQRRQGRPDAAARPGGDRQVQHRAGPARREVLHRGPAEESDPQYPGAAAWHRWPAAGPGPSRATAPDHTASAPIQEDRHRDRHHLGDARHHQGVPGRPGAVRRQLRRHSAARSTASAARTAPGSRP